jgi:hypothetical protein
MIVAKVAVALSLPRQEIRPDHFPGPCGQHRARRKPDVRRPERGTEPRVADGREQVLPPERTEHHVQHRDGARQRHHRRIRLLDLLPDDIEMGASKEQREQANRERDDDDGAKMSTQEPNGRKARLL